MLSHRRLLLVALLASYGYEFHHTGTDLSHLPSMVLWSFEMPEGVSRLRYTWRYTVGYIVGRDRCCYY